MRATVSLLAIRSSVLGAALFAALPAYAQQNYETQGLKAAIGEITVKDSVNLSVQLLLTNTTKFKKYVIFNRDRADGSLSNGDVMAIQKIVGLPVCPNSTKEGCVKYVADPEYIEAGQSISVILLYWDQTGKLPPAGKISFPLKMVVQTETVTDEVLGNGTPKAPGPPSLAVIPFSQIPIH